MIGLVAAAVAAVICLWEWQIRPVARELAAHQAELAAQQAMTQGVTELLAQTDGNGMVRIERDAEGNIQSASGDMAAINRFKLGLSETLGENLKELAGIETAIPAGMLTGSSLLAGRGPELRCRFLAAGSYGMRLESSFTQAGINQTRWQLLLMVETTLDAVLAGERVQVTVPGEFLVADAILVGGTPENYTQVLTDNSDLVADLNDYRAQRQNFDE